MAAERTPSAEAASPAPLAGASLHLRELGEHSVLLSDFEAQWLRRTHGRHLHLVPSEERRGAWTLRVGRVCGTIGLPGGRRRAAGRQPLHDLLAEDVLLLRRPRNSRPALQSARQIAHRFHLSHAVRTLPEMGGNCLPLPGRQLAIHIRAETPLDFRVRHDLSGLPFIAFP